MPAIPAPEAPPPRRSTRPLPARRHLPGEGPHPSTEGFQPVADWDWACDLFRHRFYWEAHEVWEAEWAGDRMRPEGRLLQGLICAAAFVVKQHQGRQRGADTLLERAREHLGVATAALGPHPRHIDVAVLLEHLEAFRHGGPWPSLPTSSSA